jgi:hypothetical protein
MRKMNSKIIKGLVIAGLSALALAGCGAARAPATSSAIACGLTSCPRGTDGQRCTTGGQVGIIVTDAGQPICDPEDSDSGASSPPPAAPAPVAAPAPPGTATVTGTCTLPPAPPPFDANTTGPPSLTYTVTLTDTSAADANVAQITSTFSGADGSELTSDQEDASGTILPGQSLSWTFPLPSQLVSAPVQAGTVSAAQANAPGSQMYAGDELESESILAASCQFAEWSYSG